MGISVCHLRHTRFEEPRQRPKRNFVGRHCYQSLDSGGDTFRRRLHLRIHHPPPREMQAMTGKPKRRFWQLHLSTAVVMMFAAGVVLYFCVGRFFGRGPARQTEWIESDGLAIRISVENSTVTPESPAVITL